MNTLNEQVIKNAIKDTHANIALCTNDADRFYQQIQLLKLTKLLLSVNNMDSDNSLNFKGGE